MNVNFSKGGTMVISAANPVETMALKQWIEQSLYPNSENECSDLMIGTLAIYDPENTELIDQHWEHTEFIERMKRGANNG